jgi:[ribosomal protein S18]-alanine N-acetyltransferase
LIEVRQAGALDVDDVMPIMTAAFDPVYGEAWTRGQCLGMLALPDTWLLVAKDSEAGFVGFALSRRTLDEAELLLIAVAPQARAQGVGRALIERTAAEARRRGAAKLMLEVRATNPALTLYQATGFDQIGRRRDYYRGADGALNDALTLCRSLAEALPCSGRTL